MRRRRKVVCEILTGRRFVISRSGRKLLCFNVFLIVLSSSSVVIGERGPHGVSAAVDQRCNLSLSDLDFVKREYECNLDVR